MADIGPDGKEVTFEVMGKRWYLVLFQRDDGLHCYHNVCQHQGRNLNFAPDQFMFDPEGHLVCPHHGAVFELSAGECLQGPCKGASLRSLSIKVEDGQVVLAPDSDLGA